MKLRNNKYKKSLGWGYRIYRCEYPYNAPTKEFEALLIKLGKRGIWLFRSKEIWHNWPSSS